VTYVFDWLAGAAREPGAVGVPRALADDASIVLLRAGHRALELRSGLLSRFWWRFW
jgi:hypothetical protein